MEMSFGYSSPVKKLANYCAYTGKRFTRTVKPTFEHIKPHSKGGPNGIENCIAVTEKINSARGNMRFDKWLKVFPEAVDNIQSYLNKMRGIKIDNRDYVETVKKTLNREARGYVTFKGNGLDLKA